MTGSTLLAGSTFGHYELRKLLGKGGMGEVYEARDTAKDRIVAIKILSEGLSGDDIYRERFRRESQAAAKLQEPHVVPIHDWGDVDGTLYIDMRLVRGVDLRKLLRNGPLEPERAVAIVRQIASALDAAHADGLVHRDVKPENIIVTADDFAYLVDFGIAGSPDETRLTQVGNAIGSFAYMAPERLTGQSVSPAADTYSLACVLYESLTGAAPFAAHDMALLVTAHTLAPPPRPSAVNPAVPQTFNEVIARGMTKEPADRYTSAGALGRAAQRALHREADTYVNATKPAAAWPTAAAASPGHPLPGGCAPGSSSAPGYGQSRSSERRRVWVVPAIAGAAALVVLAAVGLGIAVVRNHGHSSRPQTTQAITAITAQVPADATPAQTSVDLPPGATPCPAVYGNAGPFTRSAVGTTVTSCPFAEEVRRAYGSSGPPTSAPRRVDVYSPVTNQVYPMNCAANGPLVTCDGGTDALVYVY